MNNIIYQWLYDSHSNSNKEDKSTPLIECILILSINNMIIEYDNITQYYNSIMQYQHKNSNHNNKNNEEISMLLNGLNQQQFQIIHNNILSLKHLHNNTTNVATTEYEVKTTSNNCNYNQDEERIKKIKFEYSIFLITQNNIKNNHKLSSSLKQQQQQQQNNKTQSLFIKIWRNLVIRNEILYHTRLFNIHLKNQLRFTTNELSTYKFKDYVDELDLIIETEDNDFTLDPTVLPSNLRKLTLLPPKFNENINLFLKPYALPDSLTSVEFQYINISNDILCGHNLFPNSITSLSFCRLEKNSIKQTISKSWLPNSLKTLEINGKSFKQTIGQLPESLTELELREDYKGIIEEGAIPSSVKNYFKFDSDEILDENSIPKTTINLEFDNNFNQNIKVGVIPNNVKSITFHLSSYIGIELGSLPLSLVSLSFGQGYYSPIGANILPSNLTYIDLTGYNRPLISNLFPLSVETIKLDSFNQSIPAGYFINHLNLTKLKIGSFKCNIPPLSLPPSLTSLKLYGYQNQTENVFPQSLLKFHWNGRFQIRPGVLPSSITSLRIFLDEEYPLVVGSLPCNLKELHLINLKQDLSVNGILPDSLETIYISTYNLDCNIINKLDTNFILKYIKFN